MSALNLYVLACRLVLQADPDDQNSLTELYRLLPCLQQTLSCCICNTLSVEPMLPMDAKCQHHLCRKCTGGSSKTKSSCEWCKDCKDYTDSVQLRLLLQCYKKLCLYLTTTPLYRKLGNVNSNGGTTSLADIVQEGSELGDEYKYGNRSNPQSHHTVIQENVLMEPPNQSNTVEVQTVAANNEIEVVTVLPQQQLVEIPPNLPVSVDMSDPEISFKPPRLNMPPPVIMAPVKIPVKVKAGRAIQVAKRRGCRCGNASPSPGKLTCCGQRCPCYVGGKGCLECSCRGCRNPKKFVPAETTAETYTLIHPAGFHSIEDVNSDSDQDNYSSDECSDVDIDDI